MLQRTEAADRKSDQLDRRQETLDDRARALEERARVLKTRERDVTRRLADVEHARAEARAHLETIAGITADEAKARLIEELQDRARAEAANRLREIREEAQRTADREARKIVAMSIQRMAAEEVAQLTVSVVQLPSDEMKGRIIGREGRNIRAFEQATGIDVIIDDTPEAVVLSGVQSGTA